MGIATTQAIFPVIESGDLGAIRCLLEDDPGLVHVRHADPELHYWTPLQFAAARGNVAACRLLVERGAEVYTNPMNTYPPVMQARLNCFCGRFFWQREDLDYHVAGLNDTGNQKRILTCPDIFFCPGPRPADPAASRSNRGTSSTRSLRFNSATPGKCSQFSTLARASNITKL